MCHLTWYDAYFHNKRNAQGPQCAVSQFYTNKEKRNKGMLSNRLGLPKGYNRSKIDKLSMLHGEGISINIS